MLKKTFTVVTANLNMSQYLGDTIESVLINLEPGDEYFVIDGASSDDSVEIIKKYERHITGWVSEKDSSYGEALKKVLLLDLMIINVGLILEIYFFLMHSKWLKKT
jgi:glycosyltransferase involved in cell wall biosynthesis